MRVQRPVIPNSFLYLKIFKSQKLTFLIWFIDTNTGATSKRITTVNKKTTRFTHTFICNEQFAHYIILSVPTYIVYIDLIFT